MAFKVYSKDQDLQEAVFAAAMYWRILYGSIRALIGYKLLSFVGLPAADVYQRVLHREFLEDPHDAFFGILGHTLAHHGFSITYFLAAYLIFWGVVDVALSISMLRHYLWSFNLSMVVIGLFIAYEIFRFTHTHSRLLLTIIAIDIFIVFLIRHERGRLIARRERRLHKKRNDGSDAGNAHEGDGDPADRTP